MSFSSLPEELVDLIAEFVGSGSRSHMQRVAKRSLLDLCLVSRQTRSASQRVLYREAFVYTVLYDWKRAYALLGALTRNHERLGHFVRDTEGIDQWLYYLASSSRSYEGQDVVSETKSWYQACLMACPQLNKVDLLLPAASFDLAKVCQALHFDTIRDNQTSSRLSALRKLSFPYHFENYPNLQLEFDYTHVFDLLSSSSIRSLDKVYFGDVRWIRKGPRSTLPCFPFPVQNLTIHSSLPLARAAHLFPKDPSTLRRLSFNGTIDPKGTDLLSLPSLVGSHLEVLFLTSDASWPTARLSTYVQPSSTPRIPLQAFTTYRNLTNLELHNFLGPSLGLLETLVRKSPLLERISFRDSRWIASSNPLSTDPDDIFPEVQILATLRRFRYLTSIQLGDLPTVEPERYAGLVKAAEELGITVKFDRCEEEEEEEED